MENKNNKDKGKDKVSSYQDISKKTEDKQSSAPQHDKIKNISDYGRLPSRAEKAFKQEKARQEKLKQEAAKQEKAKWEKLKQEAMRQDKAKQDKAAGKFK